MSRLQALFTTHLLYGIESIWLQVRSLSLPLIMVVFETMDSNGWSVGLLR